MSTKKDPAEALRPDAASEFGNQGGQPGFSPRRERAGEGAISPPDLRRDGASSSPGQGPHADEALAAQAAPASALDEPPPFLGSWRNIYLLVLGELAFLVILFFALTRWAS